jgi:Type II secretion system (T2SS), protein N
MPISRSTRRVAEPVRPERGRRWLLVLVGLLVAVLVVLAITAFALPASMIRHFLPSQVHAEDFSGSLLHGAAGKFSVNAHDAGAIEWHLHPAALLHLALVTDVHWVKVGFVIDATTEVDRHGITAHDVQGGGPIENLRDMGVAAGWRGNATLSFAEFKSDYRQLTAAVGKIEVSNLSSTDIAAGSDLGGYVLQLPAGAVAADGSLAANLNDSGGPVELQAQIEFSPAARTGMLSGTLKERPEASAELRDQLSSLAQLHPRDAQGRFPVELEFTF